VSKERARRRAERLAVAERERAARATRVSRRARRRALARRLALPRRGRTGRLFARRSYAQRVTIVLAVAGSLFLVWREVDDTALRVALTALLLVALPALIVLAFGRRT
jgi:hypothetical protein